MGLELMLERGQR